MICLCGVTTLQILTSHLISYFIASRFEIQPNVFVLEILSLQEPRDTLLRIEIALAEVYAPSHSVTAQKDSNSTSRPWTRWSRWREGTDGILENLFNSFQSGYDLGSQLDFGCSVWNRCANPIPCLYITFITHRTPLTTSQRTGWEQNVSRF